MYPCPWSYSKTGGGEGRWGDYRLITDCSRPEGLSINSHMDITAQQFSFTTVDFIQGLFYPGYYSATVDIQSVYRSISVNPEHWGLQGVRWSFPDGEKYLVDTRLCFGLKSAPFIFTQVSNFVVRCLARRGSTSIVNYLDDYICVESSKERCLYVQSVLVYFLHYLGFRVSWKKCARPARVTRYLGILFDTQKMELRLPEDELAKLQKDIEFFRGKRRATVHQIQKLCGSLSHASKVVRGGRIFSHRVLELLKGLPNRKRIRLSPGFRADLEWWRNLMSWLNGKATMIRFNFGDGPVIFTDASLRGYGILMGSEWQAGWFSTSATPRGIESLSHKHWVNMVSPCIREQDNNINFLELIPIWLGVSRWAVRCKGLHLVIYSDNTQVISMINKGLSTNASCMNLIRELFWIFALFNIYLTARYVPGLYNCAADKNI